MELVPRVELSGRALVEHWTWAAEKGLMNKNTAAGLRAACAQVLSVVDDWESADLRGLDVDETLRRFQNLRMKDFKPQSLEVYKRRFRQAFLSYSSFLANPTAWKPTLHERVARAEGSRSEQHAPPEEASGGARLIDYPFPLRDGVTVRLSLPRDLKREEVRRLAAFMSTLASDFDPSS